MTFITIWNSRFVFFLGEIIKILVFLKLVMFLYVERTSNFRNAGVL